MAENTNQNVVPVSIDWGTKMLEHLKLILDKYMKKFPQYEELIAFMEDEKKMYDADGKPSEKRGIRLREQNKAPFPGVQTAVRGDADGSFGRSGFCA